MNKIKLSISLIIYVLYIAFIIQYIVSSYKFDASGELFVFGECIAYSVQGILLSAVIASIYNTAVKSKKILLIPIVIFGILAFAKPIYFSLAIEFPGWKWGMEKHFACVFGLLLGIFIHSLYSRK